MKMNLLGAAAFSLLLVATSCNDEIVEKANYGLGDNQIKFQTVLGKQTKASEFKYWGNGTGFNVYAFAATATDEESVDDATLTWELTYSGSTWDYDKTISQPGYSLTYYAVYPETEDVVTDFEANGSSASFDYTIQSTQEDLIVAATTTDETDVNLTFQHALSQINFSVLGTPSVLVQINSIDVKSVDYNAGTLTFGTGSTTWNWDATKDSEIPSNYSYALASTKPKTTTAGTALPLKDNTINNALMLMPQTFGDASTAYFTVNYTLYNAAGAKLTDGTTSARFRDFNTAVWEMGKRYLYLIDFSNYYVSEGKITFEVAVAGWDDKEEGGETDIHPVISQTLQVSDTTKFSIGAAISAHNDARVTGTDPMIFPISVTDKAITGETAIILADFKMDKFIEGDIIRIKFLTNAAAKKIELTDGKGYWTTNIAALTGDADTGDTVILTRTDIEYTAPE